MNRRLLTILAIAFVVAGGCSLLVYRIVGKRIATAHQSATVKIVAAASDIKLGSVLTASNVTEIEVAGSLPKGAITKVSDAVGRGVIADLIQGEPILEGRLASKGGGGGLASTIPQGMRASAVKVDEVVGVAGFVSPGMRVDVLISGDPPGGQSSGRGTMVRTLLQNIQVLSAGSDIQKDVEGKPTAARVVNLLVTPEQAEVLSLASNQTKIQLVLRNPLDTAVAKVNGSAMSTLFGTNGLEVPPAPREPLPTAAPPVARAVPVEPRPRPGVAIEVLNGATRSQQSFATQGNDQ